MKISDAIRAYFAAYQANDRAAVEDLLSDDFTFSSQYDDHISKAVYFERCWPNNAWIRTHHIEKLVESGSDAFVLYECEPETGARFRNMEHFKIEGDKIAAVEVFFGRSLPEAGDLENQN